MESSSNHNRHYEIIDLNEGDELVIGKNITVQFQGNFADVYLMRNIEKAKLLVIANGKTIQKGEEIKQPRVKPPKHQKNKPMKGRSNFNTKQRKAGGKGPRQKDWSEKKYWSED